MHQLMMIVRVHKSTYRTLLCESRKSMYLMMYLMCAGAPDVLTLRAGAPHVLTLRRHPRLVSSAQHRPCGRRVPQLTLTAPDDGPQSMYLRGPLAHHARSRAACACGPVQRPQRPRGADCKQRPRAHARMRARSQRARAGHGARATGRRGTVARRAVRVRQGGANGGPYLPRQQVQRPPRVKLAHHTPPQRTAHAPTAPPQRPLRRSPFRGCFD